MHEIISFINYKFWWDFQWSSSLKEMERALRWFEHRFGQPIQCSFTFSADALTAIAIRSALTCGRASIYLHLIALGFVVVFFSFHNSAESQNGMRALFVGRSLANHGSKVISPRNILTSFRSANAQTNIIWMQWRDKSATKTETKESSLGNEITIPLNVNKK